MSSTLLGLPEELLHVVLGLLPFRSLESFSRTSRSCHTAALYRLSSHVFIDLGDVTESVQRYTAFLDRYNTWAAVRRLTLGFPYVHTLEGEQFLDFPSRLYELSEGRENSLGERELLMVGAFARRLDGLMDFVLEAASSSLPLSFLSAVHESHPKCRLHLRYCAIYRITETAQSAKQEPLSLPPLHSVWIDDTEFVVVNGKIAPEYTLSFDCSGSLKPGVKEVRYFAGGDYHEDRTRNPFEEPQDKLGTRVDQSSIQFLQIVGYSPLPRLTFYHWSRWTDFSILRELDVATETSANAMNFLAECAFPALVRLGLVLRADEDTETIERSSRAAEGFLCNLPPLLTLKLSGRLPRDYLDNVIIHHGSNLKELWLQPIGIIHRLALEERDVRHIAEHCPVLKKCTFTIVRSQSSAHEVSMYQLLGTIPGLTEIDLRLDVKNPLLVEPEQLGLNPMDDNAIDSYDVPTDPSFDDFDVAHFDESFGTWLRPRNGHVRIMLVNAALDQSLALSIFDMISKTRLVVGGCHQLTMNIRSVGGGDFGSSVTVAYIADVFNEISRAWLLERTQSNTHELGVSITEVERQAASRTPMSELNPSIEPIFRRIWPGKGDWKKEWKSLLPETS